MMRLFRKPAGGDPLVVSMAGVKLGERVLVLGTSDPSLVAGAGVRSGLTGRTCVVGESREAAAGAARAAEEAGALVEGFDGQWHALPFNEATFDVVLVRDVLPTLSGSSRTGCLSEVMRVLRPSGRVMVIDSTSGSGLIGRLRTRPEARRFYAEEGGATAALTAQGFKAVRAIAQRDGLVFTEGARPARP
jgi:ubiquinone/menaquinone biosynthesis C-methylase UbiE